MLPLRGKVEGLAEVSDLLLSSEFAKNGPPLRLGNRTPRYHGRVKLSGRGGGYERIRGMLVAVIGQPPCSNAKLAPCASKQCSLQEHQSQRAKVSQRKRGVTYLLKTNSPSSSSPPWPW